MVQNLLRTLLGSAATSSLFVASFLGMHPTELALLEDAIFIWLVDLRTEFLLCLSLFCGTFDFLPATLLRALEKIFFGRGAGGGHTSGSVGGASMGDDTPGLVESSLNWQTEFFNRLTLSSSCCKTNFA